MVKRIFLIVLCIFPVLFTVFYGAGKIGKKEKVAEVKNVNIILNLWHIDTFEGGFGSRAEFLTKCAVEFENKENALILVTSMTASAANEKMKDGTYPDMLSFGNGVYSDGFKELDIKEDTILGKLNGKRFAVPYLRGNYVLISKAEIQQNIENLIVAKSDCTQPLTSFILDGYTAKNVTVLSPKKALYEYLNSKNAVLLTTQRDIVRLNNLNETYFSLPLNSFNDLYQYIAITGEDSYKNAVSKRFIEYLLTDNIQQKIKKLSMFSVNGDIFYEDEALNNMQKVKSNKSVSPLTSIDDLTNLHEYSLLYLKGDMAAKKFIDNIII